MPGVDTPFFTELRPLEELSVAATAGGDATMPLQANVFSAMITTVAVLEEPPLSSEDAAAAAAKSGKKRQGAKGKADSDADYNGPVRVSLIANLNADGGDDSNAEDAGAKASVRAVTLASFIFDPQPKQSRKTKRSEEGDLQAEAEVKGEDDCVIPLAIQQQTLRVPLVFRSNSASVRSLAVVAFTVPAEQQEDATDDKKKKVSGHLYKGSRRFVLRMIGMQQTTLTKEQVMLLNGGRQ